MPKQTQQGLATPTCCQAQAAAALAAASNTFSITERGRMCSKEVVGLQCLRRLLVHQEEEEQQQQQKLGGRA
jgi:hypothetical protein